MSASLSSCLATVLRSKLIKTIRNDGIRTGFCCSFKNENNSNSRVYAIYKKYQKVAVFFFGQWFKRPLIEQCKNDLKKIEDTVLGQLTKHVTQGRQLFGVVRVFRSQCGNFRNFLPTKIYVKLVLNILISESVHFE